MESKEIDLDQVEKAHVSDDMMEAKLLYQDAKEATVLEHTLTFWQAVKTYRKAVFWSVMVSTSIIMVCTVNRYDSILWNFLKTSTTSHIETWETPTDQT